jgi:hypothetical protein
MQQWKNANPQVSNPGSDERNASVTKQPLIRNIVSPTRKTKWSWKMKSMKHGPEAVEKASNLYLYTMNITSVFQRQH